MTHRLISEADIFDDQGARYQPWTNGYAIGFKVTLPEQQVQYIYLNPSSFVDTGEHSVTVYIGTQGEADQDEALHHYDIKEVR